MIRFSMIYPFNVRLDYDNFISWCVRSMKNMERILWICLMECSLSCCWTRVTTVSLLLVMRLGLLPFTLDGDSMVIEIILNLICSSWSSMDKRSSNTLRFWLCQALFGYLQNSKVWMMIVNILRPFHQVTSTLARKLNSKDGIIQLGFLRIFHQLHMIHLFWDAHLRTYELVWWIWRHITMFLTSFWNFIE